MELKSSLAIVRMFSELKRRAREGWRATPAATRRSYLRTLAVGTAGLFLLMVLLMKLAQAQLANGSLDWEKPFLENMETNPPFSFSTALWVQTFGTDITLWVLIITTAGMFIWARRPLRALSLVLAYVGLDIIVRIGWGMWDRVRPDIIASRVHARTCDPANLRPSYMHDREEPNDFQATFRRRPAARRRLPPG